MRNESAVDKYPNRTFRGTVADLFTSRVLQKYEVIHPENISGVQFCGGDEIYHDAVNDTWHYVGDKYRMEHVRDIADSPKAPRYDDPCDAERTVAEVFDRVRMQEEMARHLAESTDALLERAATMDAMITEIRSAQRVTSKGVIEALGILDAIREATQPKGAQK